MTRRARDSAVLLAWALLLLSALPAPLPAATNKELAQATIQRGIKLSDAGRLDAAIAEYSQAIRLDPQYTLAYLARGKAKLARNDLDGAIADDGTVATGAAPRVSSPFSRGTGLRACRTHRQSRWAARVASESVPMPML